MDNYIILNGINSKTITGLIIQSLPPITKPLMRTNIETIDGKDGDIITKLGYSAYDKEISIGLSYNYNVDDVIEYFNSEGIVIFSNEPTKYYKYTILDQIDFEKLIRFKTAKVKMHVQPFKYSSIEEDIEENATETDNEGSNFTLENTENGAGFIDLKLKGNTFQETTEGYNKIALVDTPATTKNGMTYKVENGIIILSGTATEDTNIWFYCNDVTLPSGNYYFYLSKTTSNRVDILIRTTNTATLVNFGNKFTGTLTNEGFNLSEDAAIHIVQCWFPAGTVTDTYKIMISTDSHTADEYEKYTGGIASPNPSYPSPVNVVKGDNEVVVSNKNIVDKSNYIADTWESTKNGWVLNLKAGTYTLSANTKLHMVKGSEHMSSGWGNSKFGTGNANANSFTFTINEEFNQYLWVTVDVDNETIDVNKNNIINFNLQLEKGSTATSYVEHQEQVLPINLNVIELCKIGDYQDYIYYENNKWYKYGVISKVGLNGSEDWYQSGNGLWYYTVRYQTTLSKVENSDIISNCFIRGRWQTTPSINTVCQGNNSNGLIGISKNSFASIDDLKTFLSTHTVVVYGTSITPTTTEITDETLISQLNTLKGATTYEGETNIITAGDLQPIIYVKTYAMDNPSYTVTNSGNYFAKPVMTIYGIGTVGVYLDGVQVLSLALNENQTDHITIDVPNMNAYTDTINTLRNRAVTGDYNNLKFNVGDNELSFSGTIQGFIIQNYSRWL